MNVSGYLKKIKPLPSNYLIVFYIISSKTKCLDIADVCFIVQPICKINFG